MTHYITHKRGMSPSDPSQSDFMYRAYKPRKKKLIRRVGGI